MTNDFTQFIDLASARFGGHAIAASDEFFAGKENLLNPEPAVFIPGKFTERGKWMDGWESRRKRELGNDWCLIKLGLPGIIRGFSIDTAHFKGNQPECSTIDAAELPGDPDGAALQSAAWRPILGRTPLSPDRQHPVPALPSEARTTHIRFNIHPDGGVARLRVHGEVLPDWPALIKRGAFLDLAAAEHGGLVVACNDMHFGSRQNLIMPGRAANMGDGWETRRKRGLTWKDGRPVERDWAIVRLGRRGTIRAVEVDTNHFKGNFPESCQIECCDCAERMPDDSVPWRVLLPRTKLRADTRHQFESELAAGPPCTHARLSIYPDGGVSRLRLQGLPA